MKTAFCLFLFLAFTGVGITAPAATPPRTILYYRSTMLPGEVSAKPANDSMGMAMEPVYEGDEASGPAIRIGAVTQQQMNLKTAVVARGPVRRTVRTVGEIAFDERAWRDVTTKYDGWVEKLYADAAWAEVKAGAPLFEIYAPDVYQAELNYLLARRTEGPGGGPLTAAARERLRLLDLPQDFIAGLDRSGKARRDYAYPAPCDGVVMEKTVVAGGAVKAGERIFRLAGLDPVWVEAQIYEPDLAAVHEGQAAEVRLTFGDTRIFSGRLERLLPQVESATRAATARIVVANPGHLLRPGMFADVRFTSERGADSVLVPDSAVLRSGERTTVFVARPDGTFEPREVRLGARADDDHYAVDAGLQAGERVVVSGQFLLDSESHLREAVEKMRRGAP